MAGSYDQGIDLSKPKKITGGISGTPAGVPPDTKALYSDVESDNVLKYVQDCISSGVAYREQFEKKWLEAESQINCEHPAVWDKKEAWQSKVFIGLQSKTSETAKSQALKTLFPRNFFGFSGIEDSDKAIASDIITLIKTVLDKGDFFSQNGVVLQEGVDEGTSALKFWVNSEKSGINFQWRSAFNWVVDPSARNEISKIKFWADEYANVDMAEIIEEAKKEGGLYNKAKVQKMLETLSAGTESATPSALAIVRGVDGTSEIRLPIASKTVTLHEFWGKVKVPQKTKDKKDNWVDTNNYVYEDRVITIVDNKYIIRNEINPYGFIPVVFMRIKKRKYDFYGKGYILNTLDLQELLNSIVNLGFDSLKINAMDIIKLNVNAIDDENSIEYRPLAIWRLKDINGAEITRGQGVSAITDILRGVQYIDQMHQDVSGVSRHAQGASPLLGQEGAETLGEYENKLLMIETRFLGELIPAEMEYVVNLLKKVYAIISNPKLFSQKAINDILGMQTITEQIQQTDPMTGAPIVIPISHEEPRLLQSDLTERALDNNFTAIGVTQIADNINSLARIQKLMMMVLQDPTLRPRIKDEDLLKRIIQSLQIENPNEIIKSDEEMEIERQKQLQQLQQQMGGGRIPSQQ